jgi:hypothetical protein
MDGKLRYEIFIDDELMMTVRYIKHCFTKDEPRLAKEGF